MQEEEQLKVDHIHGELGFDPIWAYIPQRTCLHSACSRISSII